ncbi:hypothetical protein LY78DRAFT_211222 [Colletotrichum sublineola]|nr:hypothetical protein LY78DRAFT_211222 [Colletotrichum sublineola]
MAGKGWDQFCMHRDFWWLTLNIPTRIVKVWSGVLGIYICRLEKVAMEFVYNTPAIGGLALCRINY